MQNTSRPQGDLLLQDCQMKHKTTVFPPNPRVMQTEILFYPYGATGHGWHWRGPELIRGPEASSE